MFESQRGAEETCEFMQADLIAALASIEIRIHACDFHLSTSID
jgi:hypothetical protein